MVLHRTTTPVAPIYRGIRTHRLACDADRLGVNPPARRGGAARGDGSLPRRSSTGPMSSRGTPSHGWPIWADIGSMRSWAISRGTALMVTSVGAALDCFSDLPDEERETLFETIRVWQHTASVSAVADRLYRHPNTVRHRLRRIEKRTGR